MADDVWWKVVMGGGCWMMRDARDFRTKEILANAVALHSACADELVAHKGVRGLLASDLAEHLPAMF